MRREAPSLLPEKFNDFLSAEIYENAIGQPVTVLSALVQLDRDPWDEAAKWAGLPRPVAAKEIAVNMITPMVEPTPTLLGSLAIAHRLAARLPMRDRPSNDNRVFQFAMRANLIAVVGLTCVIALVGFFGLIRQHYVASDMHFGPAAIVAPTSAAIGAIASSP